MKRRTHRALLHVYAAWLLALLTYYVVITTRPAPILYCPTDSDVENIFEPTADRQT